MKKLIGAAMIICGLLCCCVDPETVALWQVVLAPWLGMALVLLGIDVCASSGYGYRKARRARRRLAQGRRAA